MPLAGGWIARFFVSPTQKHSGLPDDAVIRRNLALGVNAQFSRNLSKDTRVAVEVQNAFDREAPATTPNLLPPGDGRGIQFSIRKTFR